MEQMVSVATSEPEVPEDAVVRRASGEADSVVLAALLRALEGTPDAEAVGRIEAASAQL
jgi:hypothetical protein